jgi:hypothetical protein
LLPNFAHHAPKGDIPPSYERMLASVLGNEKVHIEVRVHDIKDRWSVFSIMIMLDDWAYINYLPLVDILASCQRVVILFRFLGTIPVIR